VVPDEVGALLAVLLFVLWTLTVAVVGMKWGKLE
jgi:hypothetical protein